MRESGANGAAIISGIITNVLAIATAMTGMESRVASIESVISVVIGTDNKIKEHDIMTKKHEEQINKINMDASAAIARLNTDVANLRAYVDSKNTGGGGGG